MAVAVYTTDLAVITVADATTGFTEPTSATAGGIAVLEADYFIQGTNCVSKTFNATGLGGLAFTAGAAITLPTDGAVYNWVYFAAPNAVDTKVNGGLRIISGSSTANYKAFYVGGNNTYTYGGWVNYPVDPRLTASATVGTPAGTYIAFGFVTNVVNAISKGNPFGVDAIRYGRGSLQMVSGDLANGYATFTGASTANDNISNRWGILSFVDGGFKMQGHLLLGTAGTAVDFRDSNKTITIQNTEFVASGFNLVEVRNVSSIVNWEGISMTSLSTVSRGTFTVTNDANVILTGCTFTDMGNFALLSNTVVTDSVFRRCGPVTVGNATVTGTLFDRANSTTAVIAASPAQVSKITGTTFISDGTGYAVQLTGTAANLTLNSVTFTGYAATNGTTGNEAMFVNIASGAMTISITGSGNTPSIRTAGANVTIQNAKSFTVTNIRENSEIRILRQSDSVELGGAENVSASPTGVSGLTISADADNAGRFKAVYAYGYTTDIPIYVVVFNVENLPIYQSTSLKSTDTSLLVTQITDRQYDRGTTFNPA